ncbi:MAG: hypothetical protein V1721_06280 [Pseudomonadota bacterium]
MHFEILAEALSGKKALDILVPKIVGTEHTFRIISYKGIGRIPKDLRGKSDPNKRILLQRLPKQLQGYGDAFSKYPPECPVAVILVCDLDDKCKRAFKNELLGILDACNPKPETRFCFAIEESEAWFLGDISAIKRAYSRAKTTILDSYIPDSICGTWEVLANALYSGGAKKLREGGYRKVGTEKSQWAEKITPHMDVNNNTSPSFCYFREKLSELTRRFE